MTIESVRKKAPRLTRERVAHRAQPSSKEVSEALARLEMDNERLTEALGSVQMMIDAQGWTPVFDHSEDGGLNLASIKAASAQLRELVVGNPFVKQGSHLRNVGIWGEGVEFSVTTTRGKQSDLPAATRKLMKKAANRRYLFSADAQEELERAAYTDGTIFMLYDEKAQTFQRVPLTEITADWRNPDNSEEVWAYRREWSKNIVVGDSDPRNQMVRWYYTDLFEKDRQKTLTHGGKREIVDREKTMIDKTFNRQTGWAYGIPDALPVIAWAKLYKEFLVNGYVMSRALAQIAYKVTSGTNQARQSAAAEVAKPGASGSTATLGAGTDLLPLQTAGKGYDFASGRPLAAAIAAGVQVSLGDLLADPSQGETASLDRASIATATMRRRSWEDFWIRVFEQLGLASELKVTWHDIREEQLQRVLQSWVLANSTGLFGPEPIRQGIADAIGMAQPGDLPAGYLQPNNEKTLAASKPEPASDAPVDQDDPDQGRMPSDGSGQGKDAPAGGLGNDHSTDED